MMTWRELIQSILENLSDDELDRPAWIMKSNDNHPGLDIDYLHFDPFGESCSVSWYANRFAKIGFNDEMRRERIPCGIKDAIDYWNISFAKDTGVKPKAGDWYIL